MLVLSTPKLSHHAKLRRSYAAALIFASVCLLSNCGTSPRGLQKIQHIVIVVQENRTPDNLFHGLPNADIANVGRGSLGQQIPLARVPLATKYDLPHGHPAFLITYDQGKMDGADKLGATCSLQPTGCPQHPLYGYVDPADVAPYFQMAEEYTFADRMFQSNQGPSLPAHQFLISGTSAPSVGSNLFAAENPVLVPRINVVGCTAPPQEYIRLIDPAGDESRTQFPCFEHPVISDLLDAANISWRYYTPSAVSFWTGHNAIHHLRFGPDWNRNVVLQSTQVLTDIANRQLPAVSWVIPTGQASDHSLMNDGSGPSWVASIVNAIGQSPYWSSTAIFVTWDDWGGWYDHVPPPIINSYQYGFRVPMIVISPYAKAGYVSHVTHDFGSILKFTEEAFGLPSLGYSDARADDLSDCFDFNQTPLSFRTILAPLDASHFLHDNRPALPPDDD